MFSSHASIIPLHNLLIHGIIILFALLTINHHSNFFSSGLLLLRNSGLTALDLFEDVDSAYGIDYNAPIPSQNDENGIEVPECAYNINDADPTSLKLVIDPLQQSNEYGIDIYENTVRFLNNLQSIEI